jgi:hypothetical protein
MRIDFSLLALLLIIQNQLFCGYNISVLPTTLSFEAKSQINDSITGEVLFTITTSYTTPPSPAPAFIRVFAQFTKGSNPWSSFDNLQLIRIGQNTINLVISGNSQPNTLFYTAPTTNTITNAKLNFLSSNNRNNASASIGGTLDLIAQAP